MPVFQELLLPGAHCAPVDALPSALRSAEHHERAEEGRGGRDLRGDVGPRLRRRHCDQRFRSREVGLTTPLLPPSYHFIALRIFSLASYTPSLFWAVEDFFHHHSRRGLGCWGSLRVHNKFSLHLNCFFWCSKLSDRLSLLFPPTPKEADLLLYLLHDHIPFVERSELAYHCFISWMHLDKEFPCLAPGLFHCTSVIIGMQIYSLQPCRLRCSGATSYW